MLTTEDVGVAFDAMWGHLLVSSTHEPTRFSDSTSQRLSFQCETEAHNCARTASQLLSMSKALALRREHELATALSYGLVLLARHDVSLLVDLPLSPRLWARAEDEVWFPSSCVLGVCKAVDEVQVPAGCDVSGRLCVSRDDSPFQAGLGGGLDRDWMFGASSTKASACR